MNLKQRLQDMFTNIFMSSEVDEALIAEYFHPDYQQSVDGKKLDYQGFVSHIKAQKAAIEKADFQFEHLVCEGDKVCSIHHITAKKKNGKEIQAKVIALFQFKDNKLILCDELTQLVKGEEEDRDLGSRH